MDLDQPIESLAKSYSINTQKPHFPVNTMRLYYLLLVHGLTSGNKEATDKINVLIPKISAILDARDLALADNAEHKSPKTHFDHCAKPIQALLKEVDTPQLRQTIQTLFTDIYPLQETMLSSVDQFLKQDTLRQEDLYSTLKIRAVDSILYASVVEQIADEFSDHSGKGEPELNPIYWHVNLTLQINDLVDAIVYAKQDLASNSATLVEIIKRITTNPDEVEEVVMKVFDTLHDQTNNFKLIEQAQKTTKTFSTQLSLVVMNQD